MVHLLLLCFSYSLPLHPPPAAFGNECTAGLIQRLWSDPAYHSVSVLRYGAGQAMWSPGTANHVHKCVNPEILFAPPLQRQDCSTHLSFSKYWDFQAENHILLDRQACTFNPELALQCLSDSPEEFEADGIFCVCPCYLIFEVLREDTICLQLTWTQSDCKSLFKEVIVWLFSSHITGRCKEPAQFCLVFNTCLLSA